MAMATENAVHKRKIVAHPTQRRPRIVGRSITGNMVNAQSDVAKWILRGAKRATLGHYSFRLFAGREVGAVRMMKYQCTHAGFRLHHHAFGQLHTDLLGSKQFPDALLVVQIRTRRIPEAITFASIP